MWQGNKFRGVLSCAFEDMPRLRVLNLARNALSGAVPKALGRLTELVSVDLSRNALSGALPFRPSAQPALMVMRFQGNADLVAPPLWLRTDTLRHQLGTTAAGALADGPRTAQQAAAHQAAAQSRASTARARTALAGGSAAGSAAGSAPWLTAVRLGGVVGVVA